MTELSRSLLPPNITKLPDLDTLTNLTLLVRLEYVSHSLLVDVSMLDGDMSRFTGGWEKRLPAIPSKMVVELGSGTMVEFCRIIGKES